MSPEKQTSRKLVATASWFVTLRSEYGNLRPLIIQIGLGAEDDEAKECSQAYPEGGHKHSD
jgi:hypothetical protein